MATIQDRPFSKDYSGLIYQSVLAGAIITVTATWHEFAKRKRRGKRGGMGIGSVETWQFGYLYQGRSWAKRPSPPHSPGWPLKWVKEALSFPEQRLNELRGVDAALYTRFLRGCFWFTLLHSLTTLPVLLPIHVTFSDGSISSVSMVRASITSLVDTAKGLSLLWIHLLLLIWLTFSWVLVLLWITRGAFRLRAQKIVAAAESVAYGDRQAQEPQYHPHPHPQYPFHTLPPPIIDMSDRGLRLRTIMVTNIPTALRSEKDLREYFEYYLSRRIAKPAIGITTTTQPGFLNKVFAFVFNRARGIPSRWPRGREVSQSTEYVISEHATQSTEGKPEETPEIDRVVLVRKMTELASLLERREEVLRLLETAHIKLATRALTAVKHALEQQRPSTGKMRTVASKLSRGKLGQTPLDSADAEHAAQMEEASTEGEDRMQLLVRTLEPFISKPQPSAVPDARLLSLWSRGTSDVEMSPSPSSAARAEPDCSSAPLTVWDALLSLPRSALDTYQPLIHLSALFRGKTVPAIDYYTAKLEILTSLVTEARTKAIHEYEPMPTAFVTFTTPADARKACKFLTVHPANPLQCYVTMAPSFEDLDWIRLMKPTFRVEFVKDWIVNIGVWAFTIFWIFPVSLFVTLVSIQNIIAFWPGLANYLNNHESLEEVLQSLVPTVLVSLLTLLIPLLLLLIAKKAHTIATLSALHDRIMTRYYKFLIVNVLVFFCVGTAAVQSILVSFSATSGLRVIQIVASSFPTAGPFYVGWLIFTTAMHGGIELALFGLPLLVYPTTQRQVTPRKRAVGIRPRTFNYYYWLPNHTLVIHVLLVFAVLNPLVIPFGCIYFGVQTTVIRNQLLHVYAKNYEANGQIILVRLVRYTLDGLILAQAVFLAYMVVLKKTVNVAVSAVLIGLTVLVKMWLTRVCRARHECDDILEASIVCGTDEPTEELLDEAGTTDEPSNSEAGRRTDGRTGAIAPSKIWSWRLPVRLDFAYASIPSRPRRPAKRPPNPFGPPLSPVPEKSKTSMAEDVVSALPAGQLSAEQLDEQSTSVYVQRFTESPEPTKPKPVTPHPPHPTWDDESSPDHTYDNPYYERELHDVLWLPRDPLGLLDLDDTVDLHIALTSQPGASTLGAWRENELVGITTAVSLSSLPLSIDGFDDDGASIANTVARRKLTGMERIDLPPDIAVRVGDMKNEDDVETAITSTPRRPGSQFSHRVSSNSGAGPSTTELPQYLRPPSSILGSSRFRSFSMGEDDLPRRPHTAQQASSLSVPDQRHQNRSASIDYELSMPARSHGHSHMRVGRFARSAFSVTEPLTAPSVSSAHDPRLSSLVSMREAVVSEAMVEEEHAAQERLLAEMEEAERAQKSHSLWKRWMFAQ